MSTQGYGVDISLLAGADLSAAQFKAVKVDNAGAAVLAAAGDFAIGVLQNAPASGQAATIRVSGKSKFAGDAAVAAGAKVTSSADGQIVTATVATDNVLGVCLEAVNNAGEIGSLLITTSGVGVAD
jgi:hypothetical protein